MLDFLTRFNAWFYRCALVLAMGLALSSCGEESPTSTYANEVYLMIDRVFPVAAPPGTFVTIDGKGFYKDSTKIHVDIGGMPAKIISLNPYKIVVTVPENARGRTMTVIRDPQGGGVGGASTSFAFQVIDSPYPFTAYTLEITGVTGITAHKSSSDNGNDISWSDTSELSISNQQADLFGPDGTFCDTFTNGDTIRICSYTYSSQRRNYDRFTLVAVVDSVRGVISRVELNQSWLNSEYTSPSNNMVETGGSLMIFRNIPYTRLPDGSLQVDATGAHIFDYISAYDRSYASDRIDEDGWASTNRSVRRLVGASDDARFKLRLFKHR